MANRKGTRRGFGTVDRLASGRHRARYTGPDGRIHSARRPDGGPLTFQTKGDAETWLDLRRADIVRGAWLPPVNEPAAPPVTFGAYATAWLAGRDLERRTADHYAQLLRDHITPAFGDTPVVGITPAAVRGWHARLKTTTGPTARAHAYALLRTVCNTAVSDEVISANPCRVRGAGQSARAVKIRPATLAELETLVAALPPRYRLMALFAAWCALRFGELAELRRRDVDMTNGVIRVRRGVTRATGERIVKDPKSQAGKRDVAIPPHLLPLVKAHLADHAQVGAAGLLFPAAHGGHMAPSTLYRVYYPAREAAGRADLRFHDLRHTGATLAAATGATLAELMARLGHSTPGAAMRYQHAAAERDKAIAAALSGLAAGTVTPITKNTGKNIGAKSSRRRRRAQ